jgi:hypothetical protein
MKNTAAKTVSFVALAATIVPSLLYFAGTINLDAVKVVGLLGTVLWFVTTPLWMGRQLPVDASEVEI